MSLDADQVVKKVYDSTNNALRVVADGLVWRKYTVSYTDFSAAATTESITLFSLAAGEIIHQTKVKHSVAFAAPSLSDMDVEVGISGTPAKYCAAFDVDSAVSATNYVLSDIIGSESHGAAVDIEIKATAVGDNLEDLTAGSLDVWVLVSKAI